MAVTDRRVPLPEPPVIQPGHTFASVTDKISSAVLTRKPPLGWYVGFGIGFYMLHTCIQLHVTELSQTARGTALSLHSCAFFSGQAFGPIYYGFAFGHIGNSASLMFGAAVMIVIGLVCARFLRHRRAGLISASGLAERP